MDLEITEYDLGVKTLLLKTNHDERGNVSEIFRTDWLDFFEGKIPQQTNLSKSKPGVIRAWHKHNRNQIDYFIVTKGTMKICITDKDFTSETGPKFVEIIANESELKIIKIPGHFWHGTKTLGKKDSEAVYFISNLYDYDNPDEERLNWDDPSFIDPRSKSPYNWNDD